MDVTKRVIAGLFVMIVSAAAICSCRSMEGASHSITTGLHNVQKDFETGVRGDPDPQSSADPASSSVPAGSAAPATPLTAPPGAMIVIMPPGVAPPSATPAPTAAPGTY